MTATTEGTRGGELSGLLDDPALLAHAYDLVARLVAVGPRPATLDALATLPPFEEWVGGASLDEHAADHHALFGLDVYPSGGFYLEPERLAGGAHAVLAGDHFAGAGFGVPGDVGADHLGAALAFLSGLSSWEAEAVRAADDEGRRAARARARAFLDEVLLPWMPPFAEVMSLRAPSLWTALALLVVDLVATHRARLGGPATSGGRDLSTAPDLLADPGTGLRDFAELLTTPVFAGVHLGRPDLTDLARRSEVPRGFGPRDQELANLLRAAAHYDRIADVFDDVAARLGRARDGYATQADRWPALTPFARRWEARAAETHHLVVEARRQATAWVDDDGAGSAPAG